MNRLKRGDTHLNDEDSDTGDPIDVAVPLAWELQAAAAATAAAQAHEFGRAAGPVPQEKQPIAAPAPDPEDTPLPRRSTRIRRPPDRLDL